MGRAKGIGFAFILLALGLATVGCCKAEQDQLAALTAQYNDMSEQNTDLRSQVSQARQRQAELLTQLDTKNSDLDVANAEIARLKSLPPPTPPDAGAAKGWQATPFGDKVTVGSDVLFSSGRATLTSAGAGALAGIVRDLKTTYSALPVRVYGYTDSDPIKRTKHLWKDNLDLSANRAMAVTRHLISKGVRADRIETVAMGATNFLTSNTTKSGKAKNRRVEIFVIKKN